MVPIKNDAIRNKKLLGQLLLCIVACIPVLLFSWNYLDIPTKISSITILVVLICLIIASFVFDIKFSKKITLRIHSNKFYIFVIYIICLLTILSIQPSNEGITSNLNFLSIISWLRVIAGLFVGIFFPGYILVSLFKHKLNAILLLLVSVLLSIFLNSMVTFVAVELYQPVLLWIVVLNTSLLAISIAVEAVPNKKNNYGITSNNNRFTFYLDNQKILLLLLCLFQFSILLSVFIFSRLVVPNGDMWDHAAFAVKIANNDFLRFGYLIYPPFFSVHLLSCSELTGLPSINTSNILGLTNLLLVLAFYELVFIITKKKAIAFLSAFVFTLFGSFTFFVQTLIGSSSFIETAQITTQINSVYPLAINYAYAPVSLTLLSVLVITALFLKKEKTQILYGIEALLIANLFLMHVAETIYVFIFLLVALMLNLTKLKDLITVTTGVWLAVLVLSIFPFTESSISLYIALIYTSTLVLVILNKKLQIIKKLAKINTKIYGVYSQKYFKLLLALFLLFLYGLFLLMWTVLYSENGIIPSELGYLGAFPTYFLPIAFGIPIVLSMIYIINNLISNNYLNQREAKVIKFLLVAITIAFLLGKGITLMGISGDLVYRELRIIQTFGGITFSIFSGIALYKLFNYSKNRKVAIKYLLAFGIGILFLFGSMSTILSAALWTNTGVGAYSLNSDEIEGLNYLKKTVNPSTVVLTYSEESNQKVGLTGATTINRFSDIFNSVSSSIPKDFLQHIDYIYLTNQDYAKVQESDNYMRYLLDLLPVTFTNSEITIFQVFPIRSYANNNSSLPVIVNGNFQDTLPKLAALDSLGLSYNLYSDFNTDALAGNDLVILLNDVSNPNEASKYLEWAQHGGHLVIMDDGSSGYFSNLMAIQTKLQNNFFELWNSENSYQNWTFDLRGGLRASDISLSTLYQDQNRNSLLVNATSTGTLGFSYSREGPRVFPFAIGTCFMLLQNSSTIFNSLILSNSLDAGVGLWGPDYSLDYYYDGGQIIDNIANISLNCWQKIELYFPNSNTCNVYLNDTLIFTGPRSQRYDPLESTYMSENDHTVYAYFVGKFSALWNGLYYMTPKSSTVNGLLLNNTNIPIDSFSDIPLKQSLDPAVKGVSWYTLNDEVVSAFVFTKDIGYGKLVYIESIPAEIIKQIDNSSKFLLISVDSDLINYNVKNTLTSANLPIEIYGNQELNGTINMKSNLMILNGVNDIALSLKFQNRTELVLTSKDLTLSSNGNFTLSLNGYLTIKPLYDSYSTIMVPQNQTITISCNDNNSVVDSNSSLYTDLQQVTIDLSEPLNITVRSAEITDSGITQLDGCFFNPPYDQLVGTGEGTIIIKGEFNYTILFSDKNADRSFGNSAFLSGTYKYDYQSFLNLEFPNTFFTLDDSLLTILLFICSGLTISFAYALKNHKIRAKKKHIVTEKKI
jgi:hypothetical protein